jgi:hypothetical protein
MLMPLSDADFTSILEDKSKKIVGDIEWLEDEDHSPALEFRAEVKSEKGWPLFIKGSYNSLAMALTYALILQTDGRIYGLDLGKGHINHSPQRLQVGEKHKHRWTEQYRDKNAYIPEDITAPVSDPLAVWSQFCTESNIEHDGEMKPLPSTQQELFL